MNAFTTETRSHGGIRMNAATVYNSRGGKASAGLSSSGSSSATAPDFPFGPIPGTAGTKENGSSAGSAGAFERRSMRSNHQARQKAARTVTASRKPVMPKLSPCLYVSVVRRSPIRTANPQILSDRRVANRRLFRRHRQILPGGPTRARWPRLRHPWQYRRAWSRRCP